MAEVADVHEKRGPLVERKKLLVISNAQRLAGSIYAARKWIYFLRGREKKSILSFKEWTFRLFLKLSFGLNLLQENCPANSSLQKNVDVAISRGTQAFQLPAAAYPKPIRTWMLLPDHISNVNSFVKCFISILLVVCCIPITWWHFFFTAI